MAVLFAEIVISLFAVFGLYAAVRFFCACALLPKELAVSLEISRSVGAEEAAFLFCRAREYTPLPRGDRVVVLVHEAVEDADAVAAHFTRLGAVCYIVK
ncbi:MAG: hypothetical protein IJC95_04235 [Clostridia bacterium]|nr:hypothetical protein [Clostridia bacterium]